MASSRSIAQNETIKVNRWRKFLLFLATMAEISNVGIFLDILAKWVPRVAALSLLPFFVYLKAIADPLIYFFRALIRLTLLTARYLGLPISDAEKGESPRFKKWRTAGDILSLCFFVLAIVTFAGLLIAPPVNLTVAWALALTGLMPIGFFDYVYPASKYDEKFAHIKNDPCIKSETKDRIDEKRIHTRNSRNLFLALLVGLSLLLICGTAAAFAPPLLVPILIITSKVASIFLGGIAVSRFINFMFHHVKRLHVMDEFPKDLKEYAKDYILVGKSLFYITSNLRKEAVVLENFSEFSEKLTKLREKNFILRLFSKEKLYNKITLSEELRDNLIPLNEKAEAPTPFITNDMRRRQVGDTAEPDKTHKLFNQHPNSPKATDFVGNRHPIFALTDSVSVPENNSPANGQPSASSPPRQNQI